MIFFRKKFKKCIAITAAMLIACSAVATGAYAGDKKNKVDYDQYLFDNSIVHEISITISDEDWADLLANPKVKTKYNVSVDVDGEHYDNVSMATKGNSSLSAVASSGSQRFSFKLNFGYYADGQKYHGAKKINLSNTYQDATYMKDYIVYEMFRALGVDSPLTSYVQLSINGEVYGLYLAVEEIDGAYVDRAKDGKGEIYKPNNDPENGANVGGDSGDSKRDDADTEAADDAPAGNSNSDTVAADRSEAADDSETVADDAAETIETPAAPDDEERPARGESNGDSNNNSGNSEAADSESEGFSSRAGGEDLKYNGDDLSNYTNIFDKAETKTTEEDHERVVAALKNLSEGNIYEGLDADEVARYFAVHNFVLNYDSYTGTSLHNYYLYENDGLLQMLPWDYNQSFGSFMGAGGDGEGATGNVNWGIDSPLSNTTESSRPMWAWIVSDEKYTELYHSVMDELINDYIQSSAFEAEMQRVYEMIRPYVESDPHAFFTVDQFDTAYQTLVDFVLLRAESIRKQLDGTLASKTSEQKAEDKVDGSEIDLGLTSGSASKGDSNGDSKGDSAGSIAENSDIYN